MPFVVQVMAASRAFEKAGQDLFRPHRLTLAQFNLMSLLSDADEGMRAADLAQGLVVDASNVTGLLKRMKKVRLLKDVANPADRREHIVVLTAKGRRIWKKANRKFVRTVAAVESAAGSADRATAERVLRQITAALP